jgi:hypothetical protein
LATIPDWQLIITVSRDFMNNIPSSRESKTFVEEVLSIAKCGSSDSSLLDRSSTKTIILFRAFAYPSSSDKA